jgi:hypothetical protein
MQHLPPNFADDLAQVLEPSDRAAAARIIEAASALDDVSLRTFLELFAQRVRASEKPITQGELQRFLAASKRSRASHGL